MNKKFKLLGFIFACILIISGGIYTFYSPFAKSEENTNTQPEVIIENKELTLDEKVDKIVASMSKGEKIGQMLMIGIHGTTINRDSQFMFNEYKVGGIILFDRNMESPEQVKQLTDDLQANCNGKVPLFIALDEEGGDVVRMADKLTPPPSQLEIGQTNNPEKAKEWAVNTAKSLKAMGININFAPVADVGSNDTRSYSTDPTVVTNFVKAAASGYEQENIIYSLKHFPGIGKGIVDSHIEGSSIDAAKDVLMAEDLLPFNTIIKENDPNNYFVLVSHLNYPALDSENPASLSSNIMTDLLRKELGFNGIIITDDMEMGAIANNNDFASIGVKAVKAGADIVLVCHEYQHEQDVYDGLLNALNNGEITQERIDESVKRIVKAKLLHLYQQ